ncbi:MAG: hypothetical protein RQ862_09810 [Candidatus Caldarchaeales archaeon]|jgi:hypothetical protein|nr:hypothetical protein [Candidatus Caldarchaeales archaeon]
MARNILLYLTESAKKLLPGYIKTSKGLILPREIYYTLTNIKGFREGDRSSKEGEII